MTADAQDNGWGPGWPHCQTNNIRTLVRADGLRIPLRIEILPLVAWLMDETERLGYDIKPGETWGFSCRAIRGFPDVPSNHSWGLAVDVNAPENPMGNPLRTDIPVAVRELWKAHMFRWGGDYKGRKDSMHFEFMGTPADAARIIRDIMAKRAPLNVASMLALLHPVADPKAQPAVGSPRWNELHGHLDKAALARLQDLIGGIQLLLDAWITVRHVGLRPLKMTRVYDQSTALYVAAFGDWMLKLQSDLHLPKWGANEHNNTGLGPVKYGALQFWAAP